MPADASTLTVAAAPALRLRRVLLIVNPASRCGQARMPAAVAEFRRLGITVDVVSTRGPGDGGLIARERAGDYDAVFTLGGDGTAIEVIGALSPENVPVGILPGGTGNLMARALSIPLTVRRAVRRLVRGGIARIDLGRLSDGRRFAVGVGYGIDAAMIANASPRLKQWLGIVAYVVTGTMATLRRKRFEVCVTVDGVCYTRHAAEVLVSNIGTVLNGLVTLGPDISAADGVLNICLFDPQSVWDSLRIMRKLMFRDFRPDPAMAYYRGTSVTVIPSPLQAAQADGELLGPEPLSMVAEPAAGCIIVPSGVLP